MCLPWCVSTCLDVYSPFLQSCRVSNALIGLVPRYLVLSDVFVSDTENFPSFHFLLIYRTTLQLFTLTFCPVTVLILIPSGFSWPYCTCTPSSVHRALPTRVCLRCEVTAAHRQSPVLSLTGPTNTTAVSSKSRPSSPTGKEEKMVSLPWK